MNLSAPSPQVEDALDRGRVALLKMHANEALAWVAAAAGDDGRWATAPARVVAVVPSSEAALHERTRRRDGGDDGVRTAREQSVELEMMRGWALGGGLQGFLRLSCWRKGGRICSNQEALPTMRPTRYIIKWLSVLRSAPPPRPCQAASSTCSS